MPKRRVGRCPKELRRTVVERFRTCKNISALSRELGLHRRLLYKWRDQFDSVECEDPLEATPGNSHRGSMVPKDKGHPACSETCSSSGECQRIRFAYTDATVHPQRVLHRTTFRRLCSALSPGTHRSHFQVKHPGRAVLALHLCVPSVPSKRHTSNRHSTPTG